MKTKTTPSPRRPHPRGFTLVELMITIAVSSVLIAALYQLFAKTSEAMYEVDSLSEVTNRGRFAVERLTTDVESAGAYASASLGADPWRNQPHMDIASYTARGLILRPTAQDYDVFELQSRNNASLSQAGLISSDELIVMGALDYPFGVEVSDLQPGYPADVTSMVVPVGARSLGRLFKRDPFDMQPVDPTLAPKLSQINRLIGPAGNLMSKRVLRIRDRNGFVQMAPLDDSVAPDANGLILNLDTGGDVPGLNGFIYRRGGLREGLEPSTGNEDDVGYEVSLVDAYRYRLCQDPSDATNLRLVRERIDAGLLLNPTVPAQAAPPICGRMDPIYQPGVSDDESSLYQVVIADNVVDFQVWVDCANVNGTALVNTAWHTGWRAPRVSDAGYGCLSQNDGISAALARILHIRFSVRTDNERRDLANFGFYDVNGLDTTTNPAQAAGPLQTIDLNDEPTTAARLKTFQTDINLSNFAIIDPAQRQP